MLSRHLNREFITIIITGWSKDEFKNNHTGRRTITLINNLYANALYFSLRFKIPLSQPIQRSELDILKHVYFAPSLCFTVCDLLIIKEYSFEIMVHKYLFCKHCWKTHLPKKYYKLKKTFQWNKQSNKKKLRLTYSICSPADFTEFFISWIKKDFKDHIFFYYKAILLKNLLLSFLIKNAVEY